MKYLTIEEVIEIHDKLIKEFGGESGIVDRSNLEFIVNKIENSKTDIYNKAAMLLYEIITSHTFVDGNKRTALEAADTFLRENGKKLCLKDIKQAGEYINDVAEGKKNIFSVQDWIQKNTD